MHCSRPWAISAAYAARDTAALQSASDTGAWIALLPGLGLAALCLLALPVLVRLKPLRIWDVPLDYKSLCSTARIK